MGVDINIYRASIGRFSNGSMNSVKSKKMLGKSVQLGQLKWTKCLILFYLLSAAATIVVNPQKLKVPTVLT